MAFPTVLSNTCTCSFGAAPSAILSLGTHRVMMGGKPVCTIMDRPAPFGMCSNPANPAVIAATAAASGVPTPAPCVPMFLAPWVPGAKTVLAGALPVLTQSSKITCLYGGVVSVTVPTVVNVKTP